MRQLVGTDNSIQRINGQMEKQINHTTQQNYGVYKLIDKESMQKTNYVHEKYIKVPPGDQLFTYA